jgi:DNA-binding response OmpR family regulator
VEDDPSIRECVAEFLGLEGYRILVARNGQAALEIAEHELPRLVLLDMRMPILAGC